MCPKSFCGLRFDLRSLLQGQMWSLIPLIVYISLIIGRRGFGCEDKSFGGVTFDIIFCMLHFSHVPPGDTLRLVNIISFTLTHHDNYMEYLKPGFKQDTHCSQELASSYELSDS